MREYEVELEYQSLTGVQKWKVSNTKEGILWTYDDHKIKAEVGDKGILTYNQYSVNQYKFRIKFYSLIYQSINYYFNTYHFSGNYYLLLALNNLTI